MVAPVLVSPSEGSVLPSGEEITLVFNEVEGALRYQVLVYDSLLGTTSVNDTNVPTSVCEGGSCTYVVGAMDPQEGAYWRVRARGSEQWVIRVTTVYLM